MKLHYKNYLNTYASKLRKSGNLSEVILWSQLKKNQLGCRFLRQRPIDKYIVDFYCPSLKLAIEIDGIASHDSKIKEDELRQKSLELIGIKVIRFMDSDVRYNLDGVIENIKSEILRLASSPPPFKKEE